MTATPDNEAMLAPLTPGSSIFSSAVDDESTGNNGSLDDESTGNNGPVDEGSKIGGIVGAIAEDDEA